MVNVVGQDNILYNINSTKIPQSLILCGECGSGRHTICRYICDTHGYELEDITDTISLETIDKSYDNPIRTLYLIDSSELSTREENVILKFLEEPPKNSIIVVLCENTQSLLPTISNRCVVWTLNRYTKDTLGEFYGDDDGNKSHTLLLAKTPGDIEKFRQHDLGGMLELANKIYDKIGCATLSNTLTLMGKVGFKDEKGKYEFGVFVKVLLVCAYQKFVRDAISKNSYMITKALEERSNIKSLNKEYLYLKFLMELRDNIKNES